MGFSDCLPNWRKVFRINTDIGTAFYRAASNDELRPVIGGNDRKPQLQHVLIKSAR